MEDPEKEAAEEDEYVDISESVLMRDSAPFYGTVLDFREYIKVAEACVEVIEASTNVRQVVLETWLLTDYFVRELLSNLWGLKQFNDERDDFDLRYELLPTSLERCSRLLERTLSTQRSLSAEATESDISGLRLPWRFIHFFEKKDPKLFEKFLEIQIEYYQKYFPEIAARIRESVSSPSMFSFGTVPVVSDVNVIFERRSSANKIWVDALKGLDDSWFRLIKRLNKVRNVAAHSYDSSRILSALGYSGPDAASQAKQECLDMIGKLLGIARKPGDQIPKS